MKRSMFMTQALLGGAAMLGLSGMASAQNSQATTPSSGMTQKAPTPQNNSSSPSTTPDMSMGDAPDNSQATSPSSGMTQKAPTPANNSSSPALAGDAPGASQPTPHHRMKHGKKSTSSSSSTTTATTPMHDMSADMPMGTDTTATPDGTMGSSPTPQG